MNLIQRIPNQILQLVCSYLMIQDIIHLGRCSSKQYSKFNIKTKKISCKSVIEGIENADTLYCEFDLNSSIVVNAVPLDLRMISLFFQTKDQGWVSYKNSCSWIEAQIQGVAGESLVRPISNEETQIKRLPLIWNYQVCQYQKKMKSIDKEQILKNIRRIRIFLRSRLPRNKIFCRSAELKLIYGNPQIVLSEKQIVLQKIMRPKKNSRRLRL